MLTKLFSRLRLSLSGFVCVFVFAIGVFLRWRFILVDHDARNFIDPEMRNYIDVASRWFTPDYKPGPYDVFLYPGAAKLFAGLIHIDPTMRLAVRVMFGLTALIPLVFMALAWAAFGKPVAKGTLIITSLYAPFIAYGGYFFPEVPMTIVFGLTLALYLWAARMKSHGLAFGLAVASGFALSVAMSFRLVALPAMVVFVAVFTLFFRGPADPEAPEAAEAPGADPAPRRWFSLSGPMRKIKLILLAGVIAGSIPLTAAMSVRCTAGYGRAFCVVSNRNTAEFLLGHYGRIETLTWNNKGTTVELTSAANPAHNYTARPKLGFSAIDERRNLKEAWKWISKNAPEAVLLSFEHVYDTFAGGFSWPQVASAQWMGSEMAQYVFLLLLLLPALWIAFDVGTAKGPRALLGSREFLVLSPLLGLIGAVFLTTGQERCRIPFDGLIIIAAVVFYHRLADKSPDVLTSAAAAIVPAGEAVKKRFAWVRPWHTDLLCVLLFVGSVYLRWRYITIDHDPRKFVWSDPKTYVDMGERWSKAGYVPSGTDAIFPPGAGFLFAALFKVDPTKLLAVRCLFVMTSLLPLVFLALGWVTFGKAVGKGAMVATCFYVPFVDYGAFFLTEVPMTLLFMSSLCLFILATRVKSRLLALGIALLAGFLCSLAVSFKFVAMPAVIFFAIVYTLFYRGTASEEAKDAEAGAPRSPRRWFNLSGPLRTIKLITLAGVIAGSLPVTGYLSLRCTRLNDKKFCLICTKTPADFMLGHSGRIGALYWKTRYSTYGFGSSSSSQHGYTAKKEVAFAITDAEQNNAEAWRWIKQNPAEAVVLSMEHVYDTFGGSVAWPPNVTISWIPSQLSQYGLFVFMLLPALWLCAVAARKHGIGGLLGSTEFLLLSPALGLMGSVAVATGEARYRIPFDGLFIVVGVQFYNRYIVNRQEQAVAQAGVAPREDAGASAPAVVPEGAAGSAAG